MPEEGISTNNISNFQLKFSYWYVSHKLQLKQGLIIFLIIASIGFYGYSIYRASMIFLVEDKNWVQDVNYLTSDVTDYSYFRQVNKAQDLQILGFDSTGGRDGQYDFIAKIKNPNPDFVAHEVLLQLISGGSVVAEKTSFIYPNEDKYVTFFGQEIIASGNPIIKIASVGWRRYHQFEQFAVPRLNFVISDIEFKSSVDSGIRGELPVSTLNFKVANNTAYSYWQIGLYMVLMSPSSVIGVNYLALDQFLSGETREVEMKWYESLPSVTQIDILPEVDILNLAAYMPVK